MSKGEGYSVCSDLLLLHYYASGGGSKIITWPKYHSNLLVDQKQPHGGHFDSSEEDYDSVDGEPVMRLIRRFSTRIKIEHS